MEPLRARTPQEWIAYVETESLRLCAELAHGKDPRPLLASECCEGLIAALQTMPEGIPLEDRARLALPLRRAFALAANASALYEQYAGLAGAGGPGYGMTGQSAPAQMSVPREVWEA